MAQTLTAHDICAAHDFSFESVFRNQFVFTREGNIEAQGWKRWAIGDWVLQYCPDLPAIPIMAKSGEELGVVLGISVDPTGRPLKGSRTLAIETAGVDFWDKIEAYLIGLAGRYIAVIAGPSGVRIYTDPVADLGVVYDPNTHMVASSLNLALKRPIRSNPVFPFGHIKRNQMRYSLGHTRDFHVKRLFGNHYLDLNDFRQRRFWPREDTDVETRPEAEAGPIIDQILERLSQNMRGFLSFDHCILPLSGGRDSRCLLGAAKDEISKAEFIFSWRFHRQSGLDAQAAAAICERMGLDHNVYLFERPSFTDRQHFFLANGYATFGGELRTLAIHHQIPKKRIILRGNIMGVLRATNWRGQTEKHLNLAHAAKRLMIGNPDDTRPAAMWYRDLIEWGETLPAHTRHKSLDLAWFDITLPHSQGARWFGFPDHFYMNPYCDRHLLELSMQLPLSMRRSDRAYDALLDRTIPHLKDIPYV